MKLEGRLTQVSMPSLTGMMLRLLIDELRLLEKERRTSGISGHMELNRIEFLILSLAVQDPTAAVWTKEILDQIVKSREIEGDGSFVDILLSSLPKS